jgi:hypothetical protein
MIVPTTKVINQATFGETKVALVAAFIGRLRQQVDDHQSLGPGTLLHRLLHEKRSFGRKKHSNILTFPSGLYQQFDRLVTQIGL